MPYRLTLTMSTYISMRQIMTYVSTVIHMMIFLIITIG